MTDKHIVLSAIALAAALAISSFNGVASAAQMLRKDGYRSSHLLIRPYLAPTGATVPKPGEPQTGAATRRERKAQERSEKITHSICSNC